MPIDINTYSVNEYMILTISLRTDKPVLTLIFPFIHATNNERIAFAKSENEFSKILN